MRAARTNPDVHAVELAEVDDPTPGAGQVLVRVRAAGLNRADLADTYAKLPVVVGRELAGEVLAVGPDVRDVRVGDRVMGLGAGFAELAVLDQDLTMPAPEGLGWEAVGALPLAVLTMHDALVTNGRLRQGEAVLVHAGSSGVGLIGIQLAAELGASIVLATSRSAAKLETLAHFLRSLSCPFVGIDTSVQDFAAVALEHTGGAGVDVTIDNIGAPVLAGNVQAASVRGRIVQVGRLGGGRAELDLEALARKRLAIVGVTFRTRTPLEVAEVVRACLRDVDLGVLGVRVAQTFGLAQVAEAYETMKLDEHVGKLVIIP